MIKVIASNVDDSSEDVRTLLVAVRQEGDSALLVCVDEDGREILGGVLAEVTTEGTLAIWEGVNPSIPISRDKDGCIVHYIRH